MTIVMSWLFLLAVFLVCVLYLILLNTVGARVQSWIERTTDRAPAGPSSGNVARTQREETAKAGPRATGENRPSISFQARAAKGFEKGRSAWR